MSRLRQLLLALMIALSTLCALEPAYASPERPETASLSAAVAASPDQPDRQEHDKLPPCHVCCGANLPVQAITGPALAVRLIVRAVDPVDAGTRLAGRAISPGSRPPRA